MKKILSLTLALALTAVLCTGCGCEANVSTHPGGMITEETTRPTIMPTPTATHGTESRETTLPQATDDTGSGSGNTGGGSGNMGGSGNTGGSGSTGDTMPTDTTVPTDAARRPRNAVR